MSVMMFRPLRDDAIPVSGGPGTVTAADVITRIRLNGGSLTIGEGEYLQVAQNNPALFQITPAGGQGLVTLTERATGASGASDYSQLITYGLIGLIAIVALSAIRNR